MSFKIEEDNSLDHSGLFQLKSNYAASPVVPQIIRRPVDLSGEGLLAVASNKSLAFMERSKLLLQCLEKKPASFQLDAMQKKVPKVFTVLYCSAASSLALHVLDAEQPALYWQQSDPL